MCSCRTWGGHYCGRQPIQRSLCDYLPYFPRPPRHFRRGEFETWARSGPRSFPTLALHWGFQDATDLHVATRFVALCNPRSSIVRAPCRPAPLRWVARSPSTGTPASFGVGHVLPRYLVARPLQGWAPFPSFISHPLVTTSSLSLGRAYFLRAPPHLGDILPVPLPLEKLLVQCRSRMSGGAGASCRGNASARGAATEASKRGTYLEWRPR